MDTIKGLAVFIALIAAVSAMGLIATVVFMPIYFLITLVALHWGAIPGVAAAILAAVLLGALLQRWR
jgi:hypothetical protein